MPLLDGQDGQDGQDGRGGQDGQGPTPVLPVPPARSEGIDRRRFLTVLGATSAAVATTSGCTEPAEKLIPFLVPIEDQTPGIATYYATTCRECSAGCGLHVRVREGRAVKIEGNPENPINRGKLCARGQAGLQGLYNPDRVRTPMAKQANGTFAPIPWDAAIAAVAAKLTGVAGNRVWFVTGHETGSFDRLVTQFLGGVGSTNRVSFEPFGHEALRRATREVFGIEAVPVYDFAAAKYVLSFGADFLETFGSPVEQTRGFADGRAARTGTRARYVHIEPRMGMTGMSADEWVAPNSGTEGQVALAIAHLIVEDGLVKNGPPASALRGLLGRYEPEDVAERSGVSEEIIERLAKEFVAGPSLAIAGGMGAQHANAAFTAAAVHILNYVAGNVNRTVKFDAEATFPGLGYAALSGLTKAITDGTVDVLFVHGANPVHGTPGTAFGDALGSAKFRVSFARFWDETAMSADLILPDSDPLEQWNDSEPRAGMHLLQQPVMSNVFDTKQTGDVLLGVAQKLGGTAARRLPAASWETYLKDAWHGVQRTVGVAGAFEDFWNESLRAGGVYRRARTRPVGLAASATRITETPIASAEDGLTAIVYPSPVFHDGRGANRPWLQELPDPVSKITWSTWVEIHPDTAGRLGISQGDHVEVKSASGSITVPAYVYHGVRRDVVAVPLGQGHTAFGRFAENVGANAYRLLGATPTAFGGVDHYVPVSLAATGVHERLASTEGSARQMGRGIAQAVTVGQLAAGETGEPESHEASPLPENIEKLLEEVQQEHYDDYNAHAPYAGDHPRWGLAIDLSRCTGCSACVTACYSENNIPQVGVDQVRRGREMSWIRIERYFEGGDDDRPLEARFLPMMCQQCGNAPCEPVCPVFASYHTPDGLNGQVYNRCVGTRYCANNCPYKVRYFNWFDSSNPADTTYAWPEPLHLLLNPDVTVRSKGVMEKCTFCVQRIRGKQHDARMRGTPLKDGEIQTACQQTCPADAIVFGDLNDRNSRVSRLAALETGYHVLDGLNTRPGVTYLRKVRNVVEA
ncbi:MAG: 4Fe-4S dicluster domain-containing protein [Gemmatimonadetes bacterium]|nr:4Fe-4S dicluster domain-containing protein [Gemmatimonadota bacterium]